MMAHEGLREGKQEVLKMLMEKHMTMLKLNSQINKK